MSKVAKIVIGLLVLLVIGAVVAGAVLWYGLSPVNALDTTKQSFVITPGQSTPSIAQKLTEAGLIKHPLFFKFEVQRHNLAGKIQAGSFKLSKSMSLNEIAQQLTSGTNDLWVTIPEGKRSEEIAEILSQSQLEAFKADDFIALSKDKEGMLFPDTYLLPKQATAGAVLKVLTNTYQQKVTTGLADKIKASGHSEKEILTLASIVEREAKSFEDMRIVSGVFWKRMSINMPLQSDVTAEYLHGYDAAGKTWWGSSTPEDRRSNSPYNTYVTAGLPPHPISNPGLNAIKAVLDPVATDDLFFLSDSQGVIHTARTLEEHNANIEKYLR